MHDIDTERFAKLVKAARESGDKSSRELGRCVATIARKAVNSDNFRNYTEDWKLDMFGDACYAMLRGVDSSKGEDGRRLFNYFYTAAFNACKRTVKRMKRVSDIHAEAVLMGLGTEEPLIDAKRKALRGRVLDIGAEDALREAHRRRPRLPGIVEKSVRRALARLDAERIGKIKQQARLDNGR